MKRNFGVDIARVLAMFMVVVVHSLNQGGVLNNTHSMFGYLASHELFNLTIVAVNIFALITGYLYSGKKSKIKRAVGLYFEVWALSLISLLLYICTSGFPRVVDIVKSVLPLSSGVFWYFNSYIGFLMFEPLLRRGVAQIKRESLLKIETVLLMFAGTIGLVNYKLFQFGYSIEWLIVLFLAGILIREYSVEISKIKSYLLVTTVIAMSLLALIGEFVLKSHAGRFTVYTSPTVIIQSLALFVLIIRINVDNKYIKRLLLFLSPLSFGVYILDTSTPFFDYILKDIFRSVSVNQPIILALLTVLLFSLIFFTLFILINYLRAKIFKYSGINKLIDKISNVIDAFIAKISW